MFPARNSKDFNISEENKSFNNEPAEVIDIILNDSHPDYINETDIGKIKARFINGERIGKFNLIYAYPLRPNIKYFPLKKEIVLIQRSLSRNANDNSGSTKYYYDVITNVYNLVNNNIIPDSSKSIIPDNNVRYDSFTGNTINKTEKDQKVGDYFIKNDFVPNLLPDEGDFILEGRSGTSIRFSQSSKDNKLPFWKTTNDGSPIMVIRTEKKEDKLSRYTVEQYVTNGGILILASDQIIEDPDLDKIKYKSVQKPQNTTKHENSKFIINYDRIIIKSKLDDIFLWSKKTIVLNSNNLYISSKNTEINSDKIVINEGKNGGLVKSEEVSKQFNDQIAKLNNLIVALSGIAAILSSNIAPLPGNVLADIIQSALTSLITPSIASTPAQFENKNVLH